MSKSPKQLRDEGVFKLVDTVSYRGVREEQLQSLNNDLRSVKQKIGKVQSTRMKGCIEVYLGEAKATGVGDSMRNLNQTEGLKMPDIGPRPTLPPSTDTATYILQNDLYHRKQTGKSISHIPKMNLGH